LSHYLSLPFLKRLHLIVRDDLVVRDYGKWFIEVMQQPLPFSVVFRFAKAHFMRFDRLPVYEQHVLVFAFNTASKLMPDIAGSGRDDGLSFEKSCLEF